MENEGLRGGFSSSYPEETSPIKKATRPAVTRPRSSSTLLVRTSSASDAILTRTVSPREFQRTGSIPARSPMPYWDNAAELTEEDSDSGLGIDMKGIGMLSFKSPSPSTPDNAGLARSRAPSGTYSSRSSPTPETLASSSTLPPPIPRRSLQRSTTVPARPPMLAAWDGAVSASEEDGEANDALGALSNHYRGDDDFDYDAPLLGIPGSRATPSTLRRPVAGLSTPVASQRPYKSSFAQPQSMVSHRYLSPSSPSSSREDLDTPPVPALRNLPHTAATSRTQPRTIPIRSSNFGPPQLIPLTPEERQRRSAMRLDSASERSGSDREFAAEQPAEEQDADPRKTLRDCIASLRGMTDSDDEEGMADINALEAAMQDDLSPKKPSAVQSSLPPVPTSPIDDTVQRAPKRKVMDDPLSRPSPLPELAPIASTSSTPSPQSLYLVGVPAIPPYRGPRSLRPIEESHTAERSERPGAYRNRVPATASRRVAPSQAPTRAPASRTPRLASNPLPSITGAPIPTRSTAPSRVPQQAMPADSLSAYNADPGRHRRSPTAPSLPTTSSAIAASDRNGPPAVVGKENRASNGLTWGGDAAAAREREKYALASLEFDSQQPQREAPAAPNLAVQAARDRGREFEREKKEREDQERRDFEWAQEQDRRARMEHEEKEAIAASFALEREREQQNERERALKEMENVAPLQARSSNPSEADQARHARDHPVHAERRAPDPPAEGAPIKPTPKPVAEAPKKNYFFVNKKSFMRLGQIGRGGSSRVYQVVDEKNKVFALKKVTLNGADTETVRSYRNEIAMLNRLEGQSRIIKLFSAETNLQKNTILMVLEYGETDLARMLQDNMSSKFALSWTSYAWQQMLEAVHVIHEEKIVHSDLKPANFVLVQGRIKLIDFGIAKAIANDTTNIQRDQQIGTVNYMSPEAIEETRRPDGKKVMKLGRASDVWSLGCILYQMVYGRPPFYSLSLYPKMKAIPDPDHKIEYPEHTVPTVLGNADKPEQKLDHLKTKVKVDVIRSMKMCLTREPKQRGSIPELLSQPWVEGGEDLPAAIPLPTTPTSMLSDREAIINESHMELLLEHLIAHPFPSDITREELQQESRALFADLKRADRVRTD